MANVSPFKEALVTVAARHYKHNSSEADGTINAAKIEAVRRPSVDGSTLTGVTLANTVYLLIPEVGHKKVAVFREGHEELGASEEATVAPIDQGWNLAVLERSVSEGDSAEVAQAFDIGQPRQIHDILGHARVVQVLGGQPESEIHAVPIEGESAVFFPNT